MSYIFVLKLLNNICIIFKIKYMLFLLIINVFKIIIGKLCCVKYELVIKVIGFILKDVELNVNIWYI